MAFPKNLTSRLTGVTPAQLDTWRAKGLVVPEVSQSRPPLWSFRDLILLRTVAFLRAETTAQRVTKAFRNLDVYDLTAHPSQYRFGTDGRTIVVELPGQDMAMDLVSRPGHIQLFPFSQVLGEFNDWKGRTVSSLTHPAPSIEVRPQRMGGWPTIEETRVPFDVIANLVDFETVHPRDVSAYYPSVTSEQAIDAVSFAGEVTAVSA